MSHELSDDAIPFAGLRVPCAVLPVRYQVQPIRKAHLPRHRRQKIHAKTIKSRIPGVVLFLMHHHIRRLLRPISHGNHARINGKRFENCRGFMTRHVGADHIEEFSTIARLSLDSLFQNGWYQRCRRWNNKTVGVMWQSISFCVYFLLFWTAKVIMNILECISICSCVEISHNLAMKRAQIYNKSVSLKY